MILETRQAPVYIKAFKDKYPNALIVVSEPFATFGEMTRMVAWGKENLLFDALVTLDCDYENNIAPKVVTMIWHLTNDIDIMAVKLRWS